MNLFISMHTGLNILPVGLAYVRYQKMHFSIIAVAVLLPIASFAFFVVHYGVDPIFKFDYA